MAQLSRGAAAEITAIAAHPAGLLAVAVAGRSITVASVQGGGWAERGSTAMSGGAPLHGVNALHFESVDALLYTEGSARHGPADWCRDLMEKGQTGRVSRWRIGAGGAGGVGGASGEGAHELLAQGLHRLHESCL